MLGYIILNFFPVAVVFVLLSLFLFYRDRKWAKRAGCEPKKSYSVMLIISVSLIWLYFLGFVLLMVLLSTGMAGM